MLFEHGQNTENILPQITLSSKTRSTVIIDPEHPAPSDIDPYKNLEDDEKKYTALLEKASIPLTEPQKEVARLATEYIVKRCEEVGVTVEDTERFMPYFISREAAIAMGRTSPALQGWLYALMDRPVVIANEKDISISQMYVIAHEISHAITARRHVLKFYDRGETVDCIRNHVTGLPDALEEAFAHDDAINFLSDIFPNMSKENFEAVKKRVHLLSFGSINSRRYLNETTFSSGENISTSGVDIKGLKELGGLIGLFLKGEISFREMLKNSGKALGVAYPNSNISHAVLEEFLQPFSFAEKTAILTKLRRARSGEIENIADVRAQLAKKWDEQKVGTFFTKPSSSKEVYSLYQNICDPQV